ncbi:hypothetical protein A2U01_0087879 [Trifolium medium]|uniref:Uncharacterized protein n=1 Tax=Trifolium medium TaxID=97028 RepID=A0A392TZN3_9FABA|nr:hypothetical protein [Trifolium medium]
MATPLQTISVFLVQSASFSDRVAQRQSASFSDHRLVTHRTRGHVLDTCCQTQLSSKVARLASNPSLSELCSADLL